MTPPRRILIVRPDRIGDVILSTPVVDALHREWPEADVFMLVRKEISEILTDGTQRIPGLKGVLPYEPEGRHLGLRGWRALVGEIRALSCDAAVVLQDTASVSWAVWAAGIPLRVGPRSRLRSWVLWNRGQRQRRSRSLQHEAEYNLELLRSLGLRSDAGRGTSSVVVKDTGRATAERWIQAHHVPERFVLIHPGMRGSAPNLSVEFYETLIQDLAKQSIPVLVTFGPGEESLKARFLGLAPCYGGREAGGLSVQAALLERASVVVAPSTGPLHMAVALRRPVVTAYPPEAPPTQAQSARRWGPWATPDRATVFVARRVENGMLEGIDVSEFGKAVVKAYESEKNR